MGIDEAIKYLAEMGATQKTIGRIVNRDQSTISKRLKNMETVRPRLLQLSERERNELIKTKMEYDRILGRLRGDGVDLLLLLKEEGPLESRRLKRKALTEWHIEPLGYPATYRRCKAFGVIEVSRLTGKKNYYVDITEKGLRLIEYWKRRMEKELKKHANKPMVETDGTVKKRV